MKVSPFPCAAEPGMRHDDATITGHIITLLDTEKIHTHTHTDTRTHKKRLTPTVALQASFTLILAAVLGAVASPVDHVIHRRFSCDSRLEGYCHASNVDSYCHNGEFRSSASQTCSKFCRYETNTCPFFFFFLPGAPKPSGPRSGVPNWMS